MRLIIAVLALASLSSGQWIETTIPLPDSLPKLSATSLVFHSPNKTVYVGGVEGFLMAIDAGTNVKLSKVMDVGPGPHFYMCSDVPGNKVYCANSDSTVTVIDGATNQPVKTFSVEQRATDLVYNGLEDRIYCGNWSDSLVRVIDCAGDSVVARIPVGSEPFSLCHSPQLNRVYCAMRTQDEVAVVDCEADTLTSTVWVRGVCPYDICYDSATNCVYTANQVSNTVSVVDCSADTLVRVMPVGAAPTVLVVGPPGKVYCANRNDTSVSVISDGGVKAVRTGQRPTALSYDPVNDKIYCANYNAHSVTVIDAVRDTAVAQVGTDWYPEALCYNPVGNNTYAACPYRDVVYAIGGASDLVEAGVAFGTSHPDLLCYNPTSDRLYCADRASGLVFVIDGNTHAVRAVLPVGGGEIGSLVWNPLRNKAYVSAPSDHEVYVIDGTTDRTVAYVAVAGPAEALCYNSANDKVYVAGVGDPTVSAIDCAGDTLVATLQMARSGGELAYNSVSNKVYCLDDFDVALAVFDGAADTVIAVLTALSNRLCFIPPHNKLYLSGPVFYIQVVDGAGDSSIGTLQTSGEVEYMSYDLGNDRVYATLPAIGLLAVYDPGTDSLVASIWVGGDLSSPLDNGRLGDANRVYCAVGQRDTVAVVSGTTNAIVRSIGVGDRPTALAWNAAHSWMYVANRGGSSITVLRDTLLVGIEESFQPQAASYKSVPTVVRDMLLFEPANGKGRIATGELLDISGRKVLDLRPGANDVRELAPGVYFVRRQGSRTQGFEHPSVDKVVIAR